MKRECLAAHTPFNFPSYPPYVNATLVDGPDGDRVELTVRSPVKPDGSCGESAVISMTVEDFRHFIVEADLMLDKVLL